MSVQPFRLSFIPFVLQEVMFHAPVIHAVHIVIEIVHGEGEQEWVLRCLPRSIVTVIVWTVSGYGLRQVDVYSERQSAGQSSPSEKEPFLTMENTRMQRGPSE